MKAQIICFTAALFCFICPVEAQNHMKWADRQLEGLDHQTPEYHDEFEYHNIKEDLTDAILNSLVLCQQRNTGKCVRLKSCRTAVGGCAQRIWLFAGYIIDAATEYNLNPWMLAAMAYNESRFNPFAVGPIKGTIGSMGILQLHPKSKRGRKSLFIRNRNYRNRCKHIPGNCQEEIVFKGADHVASAIKKCDGSLALGLSMYNTGRCEIRRRYIRNTSRAWRTLQFNNGEKDIPWCSGKKRNVKYTN